MRITDLDIIRFTEGDCHYLARAINHITGWPIHCFTWDDGEPEGHAFIVMPNGKILDVEGVHTPEQFYKSWHATTHKEFPFEIIRACFGTPDYGKYTYTRAKQVAEFLVTQTMKGKLV